MYNATALSHRDRAVLRAVAAGRCRISRDACAALTIDGLSCCDQLAGPRLTKAGLIAADPNPGAATRLAPARLTPAGNALLRALHANEPPDPHPTTSHPTAA